MTYKFISLVESQETHNRVPTSPVSYTVPVYTLTYSVDGEWGSLIAPVTKDAQTRIPDSSYVGSRWADEDHNTLVLVFEGERSYA